MNPLFLMVMLYSVAEASAETTQSVEIVAANPSHDTTEEKPEGSVLSAPLTETTYINQDKHRALSSVDCEEDEQSFRLDLSTDNYGFENRWKLLKNTSNGPREVYSGPPARRNYARNARYIGVYCLTPGTYKFVITDLFKDGMCCAFGQGKYVGYLENEQVFSSPDDGEDEDWERRSHRFDIVPNKNSDEDLPFDPKIGTGLTSRDQDWLDSHNSRRQEWHEWYGKTYIPLNWSNALKEESQIWAQKLADDCALKHDPNNGHGENLALNQGTGQWGEMKSTEAILIRFVEKEADDEYPANGHLTQVLWRSTKYVGCADASSPYGTGTCRAQVCRYTRPGNCNMARYRSNGGDWWLTPMLMDESFCGNECPPDGCN
mmetsp:Transcript_10489/g.19070  ORF Transcript_10489/g.19070 Transcript_10489/m.19070 type:complete len:375 (-) Transcript_10489:232-1356(-)